MGGVGIHGPEHDAVYTFFGQRIPDPRCLDQMTFVEFCCAMYAFGLAGVEGRPLHPRLKSWVVGMCDVHIRTVMQLLEIWQLASCHHAIKDGRAELIQFKNQNGAVFRV